MSRDHACVSEAALYSCYSVFALTTWISGIICAFFSVASGLIVARVRANMAAETRRSCVTSPDLCYAILEP